jgi:ferredoxin
MSRATDAQILLLRRMTKLSQQQCTTRKPSSISLASTVVLMLSVTLTVVQGFGGTNYHHHHHVRTKAILFSSQSRGTELRSETLTVTLDKPLGLILEEVQEGSSPQGVKVQELLDSGSAYASEYKDQLLGLKLSYVQGTDVSCSTFETVMETITAAPSRVTLEFETLVVPTDTLIPELPVGTPVSLQVLQEGKSDIITVSAKVGDNLRTVLLEHKIDLYRGLSKKLGNCGGGGQCTLCAIQLETSSDDTSMTAPWTDRSEWETKKIGKKLGPTARLACLTSIEGPAAIKTL